MEIKFIFDAEDLMLFARLWRATPGEESIITERLLRKDELAVARAQRLKKEEEIKVAQNRGQGGDQLRK